MNITTDGNIFVIMDDEALDAMPAGLVVAEMPRGREEVESYREEPDLFHVFEVGETPRDLLRIDPVDGTRSVASWPIYPVRVVNPEFLLSEGEVMGFEVGQRVRVIGSHYSSEELGPGATGTVIDVGHPVGWDYCVQIDNEDAFYGNESGWGYEAYELESLPVKSTTVEPGRPEEWMAYDWADELMEAYAKEEIPVHTGAGCCGKYDPCPKSEPVAVRVTIIEFDLVGN